MMQCIASRKKKTNQREALKRLPPHNIRKCKCLHCGSMRRHLRIEQFSPTNATTKPRLASPNKILDADASLKACSTQIRSDEKLDDHEKGLDSASTSKPQSPQSRLRIAKLRSSKKSQSLLKRKALEEKKKKKKKQQLKREVISTP